MPPRPPAPVPDYDYDHDEAIEEDLLDEVPARWVTMATVVGASLIAVITVQVIVAIIEGFTLSDSELLGVSGDVFHRLGAPFSANLGTTALIFLIAGVILLSLPTYFDEETTPAQDRLARIGLTLAVAAGVVLAIGSLLAVRATFQVFHENHRAVPSSTVMQEIIFLVGNLGAAVIAIYAAIEVTGMRDRER